MSGKSTIDTLSWADMIVDKSKSDKNMSFLLKNLRFMFL